MMDIGFLLDRNILNRKVGASKEIHGLLILELASICVNLTLFIVFLFIISARQIFVCVGRIRLLKEDSSVANSSSIRPSSVEGEIRDVVVGIGFKLSLLCCFYVLVLQFGILGYDGVALIREVVNGKSVDWSIIGLPDAQSLTWFVLSFSALHCKFKASEKFPLLLRVWWFFSFVICLCTLYVDGRSFLVEGLEHLNSNVVENLASTLNREKLRLKS